MYVFFIYYSLDTPSIAESVISYSGITVVVSTLYLLVKIVFSILIKKTVVSELASHPFVGYKLSINSAF